MPDNLCLITPGSVIMHIKSISFLRLIVSSCIAEFDLFKFIWITLMFFSFSSVSVLKEDLLGLQLFSPFVLFTLLNMFCILLPLGGGYLSKVVKAGDVCVSGEGEHVVCGGADAAVDLEGGEVLLEDGGDDAEDVGYLCREDAQCGRRTIYGNVKEFVLANCQLQKINYDLCRTYLTMDNC